MAAASPRRALATAATVIASQAVISGAFSVAQQAIQLGFCPRMEIRHTSEAQAGQIYMPKINERLLIGVVVLVLLFGSSSSLAAAYGIAVTGTMTATTLLSYVVVRYVWKWPAAASIAVIGIFLVIDFAFLAANMLKLVHGGWIPLLLAIALLVMMMTWQEGRMVLTRKLHESSLPIELFLRRLDEKPPLRVPGTAIYFTRHTDVLPHAMLHNLKHNKVLHDQVVLLTVTTEEVPRITLAQRVTVERLREDFARVSVRYGFMETPDIPAALALCKRFGLNAGGFDTSYFSGRETLIPSASPPLSGLRERLFILMSRNALAATDFFRVPTDRVVELGAQIPI